MTAKYPTTCGQCSLPISPGDEIAKAGARWAHVACAAGSPEVGQQALVPVPGSASAASSGSAAVASARTGRKAGKPAMTEIAGALEVWTDGACSGNPGPGGWAWVTRDGRQGSGAESPTTNQRMEIRA